MKKYYILLIILLITGFFFFDRGVVYREKSEEIEKKITLLSEENIKIENEIASISSYNKISSLIKDNNSSEETVISKAEEVAYNR